MQLTPLIERAIKRASELHDGQLRKSERRIPYITHLFSVAAIVSEYAPDEEVIAAGLLHDTLEDTPYTAEELEDEFGPRIGRIVAAVSEPRGALFSSWKARKDAYLSQLEAADADALIVSAADKIHNLESLAADYRAHGPQFLENFSRPIEDQLWFFRSVLDILERRLESPVIERVRAAYDEAEKIARN